MADFTLTANGAEAERPHGHQPGRLAARALQGRHLDAVGDQPVRATPPAPGCVGGTQGDRHRQRARSRSASAARRPARSPTTTSRATIVIIKNAKPATGTFAFTTTGYRLRGFTLTGATDELRATGTPRRSAPARTRSRRPRSSAGRSPASAARQTRTHRTLRGHRAAGGSTARRPGHADRHRHPEERGHGDVLVREHRQRRHPHAGLLGHASAARADRVVRRLECTGTRSPAWQRPPASWTRADLRQDGDAPFTTPSNR